MNTLRASNKFEYISKEDEEEEHSLEMQFPYLKMIFPKDVTIVPIIVGGLKNNLEVEYADILRPYFNNDENLFVISSDFCHWGKRFSYTHYDKTKGPIFESIKSLDSDGMSAIATKNPL
jgi:AmmeMemoRadiSam system protein B